MLGEMARLKGEYSEMAPDFSVAATDVFVVFGMRGVEMHLNWVASCKPYSSGGLHAPLTSPLLS